MLSTLDGPMLADPRPAETPSRKVVVLVADAGTNADMQRWCALQGFDLGASFGGESRDPASFEFHVTLFATVGPSALPEQIHPIEYLTLETIGFDAFGPERRTPVALLAPVPRLVEMRDAWLALAAAEPTYPEFRPHLTLSYAWDGQPALEDLPMINLALGFNRLEVRTLKDKPAGEEKGILQTIGDMMGFNGPSDVQMRLWENMQSVADLYLGRVEIAISNGNYDDARMRLEVVHDFVHNASHSWIEETTLREEFAAWVARSDEIIANLREQIETESADNDNSKAAGRRGRKAARSMSLDHLRTEISEWRDEIDNASNIFDMSSTRYGAWLEDTIDKLENMRSSEITDGDAESVAAAMDNLDALIASFQSALTSYYDNRKSAGRRGLKKNPATLLLKSEGEYTVEEVVEFVAMYQAQIEDLYQLLSDPDVMGDVERVADRAQRLRNAPIIPYPDSPQADRARRMVDELIEAANDLRVAVVEAQRHMEDRKTARHLVAKSYEPIDLSLEPVVRAAFDGNADAQALIAEHDTLSARYLALQDEPDWGEPGNIRDEVSRIIERMDEIEAELERMLPATV